jgi:hypothetical protein
MGFGLLRGIFLMDIGLLGTTTWPMSIRKTCPLPAYPVSAHAYSALPPMLDSGDHLADPIGA